MGGSWADLATGSGDLRQSCACPTYDLDVLAYSILITAEPDAPVIALASLSSSAVLLSSLR